MWWNSSRAIHIPKGWCRQGFALIPSANLEAQQRLQDWKRSVLLPVRTKGSTRECANRRIAALVSRAGEVTLEILPARLQHYVNQELPDVQAGFRKERGTRDQIANIWGVIQKKQGNFRKTSISVSSSFSKPSLDIWKFLVHIMLKPSMQDFKHDLTSMGDEGNCLMVSTFFSTTLLGNWDEDWPLPVLWPLLGLTDLLP